VAVANARHRASQHARLPVLWEIKFAKKDNDFMKLKRLLMQPLFSVRRDFI
jgi:hypothetical protein